MKKLSIPLIFILLAIALKTIIAQDFSNKAGLPQITIKPLDVTKVDLSRKTSDDINLIVQQGPSVNTKCRPNWDPQKPIYRAIAMSPKEKFIVTFDENWVIRLYTIQGFLYSIMPVSPVELNSSFDGIKFTFDESEKYFAYSIGNYYSGSKVYICSTEGSLLHSLEFKSYEVSIDRFVLDYQKNTIDIFGDYKVRNTYVNNTDYGKRTYDFLNKKWIDELIVLDKIPSSGKYIDPYLESTFKAYVKNTHNEVKFGSVGINRYFPTIVTGNLKKYVATFFNTDNAPLKVFKYDGSFLRVIDHSNPEILGFDISYDGNFIAAIYSDFYVRIWDRSGYLINKFSFTYDRIVADRTIEECNYLPDPNTKQPIRISPDGHKIAINSLGIALFDINGKYLSSVKPDYTSSSITGVGFSFTPDSKKIIVSTWDKEYITFTKKTSFEKRLRVFDLSGALLSTVSSKNEGNYILFANNSTKFIVGGVTEFSICEIDNNGEIRQKKTIETKITDQKFLHYSVNSSFSEFTFPQSSYIATYSLASNQEKKSPDMKNVISVIHPDGNSYITYTQDGKLILTDKQWSTIATYTGLPPIINDIKYSPDGSFFAIGGNDGSLRIINPQNNDFLICVARGNEWIAGSSKGYFDGSNNGGSLLTIQKGGYVYPIDQFAATYNRPDILMNMFGNKDENLANHFYSQYKKRLKRMNLSNESSVSESQIPTVKILDATVSDKFLKLKFKLEDSVSNIVKYNVFANDVPLYGAIGKQFSGRKGELTEVVELCSGKNKIEVSCFNDKGFESIRDVTYADYSKPVKGNLYFLAFGVSKYNNPAYNLQFADKDALDLSKVVENLKGGGFENVYTKVLTNEQVTPEAIKASKDFVKNAKPDDTFILFIAGHGMHDTDPEATYYYLTSNADLKNLKGTAADFETIEDLLQGIPPRNKLFLMDACESGEIDDEEQGQMLAAATGAGITSRGFKSIAQPVTSNQQPGTKRTYLYQKDRYIYNDLVRRSGAIVFSSSKGGELSYERSDIENGLFTEYIMKALTNTEADKDQNGVVSTDEMREFVAEEVAKASGNLQHPTVDRDNIYMNFGIGYNLSNTASSLTFKMVKVKGGTFTAKYSDKKVSVNDFSIGAYEVTQAQWKEVMGNNPSKFAGCDNCPVENITWNEVQQFIEKLNAKTGLKYRLPSEAEWELAARAGLLKEKDLQGVRYFGMDDEYSWKYDNSNNKTHEVGFKKPNPIGIYDMYGNASEYTSTWSDPSACNSCIVVLGGSVDWFEMFFRKEFAKPDMAQTSRTKIIGFRLVLDLESQTPK